MVSAEIAAAKKVLRSWRTKPSLWLRDAIDIDPARYRSAKDLRAWLDSQPPDAHQWCRQQLEAGKLSLVGSPTPDGGLVADDMCYQSALLDAMAEPGWYALRCANGVGKTSTAALLILWFLSAYPAVTPGGTKVVTTAGTYGQLKEQLWREIHTWAARAKFEHPWSGSLHKMQIDLAPNWAAIARASDKSSTFEGVHGDHVLVLVDEAKAIRGDLYGAFRRILRGGGQQGKYWFVFLSSPGSPSGTFWELTDGSLAHRVTTWGMSAYESDRISLDTIAEDAEDVGEDSPLFVSMVIGRSPEEGDDTLIRLSWAQEAQGREVDTGDPKVLGVDCARFGLHETIGMRMDGRRASLAFSHTGQDLAQTVGKIREAHRRDRYHAIAIDDGGLGGGVTDFLTTSEEFRKIHILPVNFGAKSDHPERYVNMKSQIAFMVRAELKAGFEDLRNPNVGLSLPADKRMTGQLTAHKVRFDDRQRYRVVTPRETDGDAEFSLTSQQSPDRAHALMLANYARAQVGVLRHRSEVPRAVREMNLELGKRKGPAAQMIADLGWS